MGDVNIKVTVKGNIAKRKQYYTGDIPDGSISMSKLAPDVMLEMNKVSDDITSLQSNKADKTALEGKADKSYNSGFIGGTGAKLNGVGGAAIGQNAQASEGVGAGKNAYASHGAALGRDTKTLHGVAAGDGAQTVDEDGNPITAIQLGKGTNTEPNTAKFFDYTIMNADGTIPRERIPDAVNRYDVSALPSKSQTYDFSDGVSKFIAVERMDVAVESETQVMMSASNAGNKYGLAQFDFGSITDGATRIIAEYDTKYDGGRWEISLVDMSKRPGTSDKSSYDTAGVAFRTGTRDANNNFYLNGDNKYDTTLNNVWVHVKADIDLTAGALKYDVSAEGALKYSGEIAVPESVGTIDGLEIYTWAQGTIYADNIKINALYDVDENGLYVTDEAQYIYKDGEPVALGADMDYYYTKEDVDGLLDEKADTSALNNYYTKNETDTKIAEAQSLIPTRHIVDELPTENIDTNGTYWVPVDDPDEKNLYTEYAYINGAWEIIGNPQKVDLTDYYTKTETDNKLTQKADASTVASMETSIEELQSDFALAESDVSALQNSKADKNAGFGGFVGGSGASLIEPDSGDVTSGTRATGGAIGFEAVSDNGGSIGHKANSVSGGAVGYQATTTAGGAVGHSAQSESGGAIGNGAKARDGGAIGFDAVATFGGAMGVSATVTSGGAIGDSSCAGDGFSGGYAARVATDPEFDYIDAIQLGQGTNNTPKTLQIYDYCLMNADGTIPPERLNDYYKKSYLDDKFSGYDTQMMMMSEAIMGKAELYDFNQLSKTVAAKADKPTITSVSGASPSVTLTDNTETQCGEVTALTLTLPSSTPNGYISSVIFTANSATPLTYPESIAMIGTDCLDGVFAPTAGVRYTVIVTYDGAGVVGYVAGYEVSA